MTEEFFELMMSRMSDEFPECLRVHKDMEFIINDKITQEFKCKKPFRVLAIQNNTQNYQHAAIIISHFGLEYTQFPKIIDQFLSDNQKSIEVISKDHFEDKESFHSSQLKFTGNVYVYTDKLVIDEEPVRKYFSENKMTLVLRDEDYWINFWNRKNPDVFICHDSRDKEFAESLYGALWKKLVKVWLDKYSLEIGDILTDKLDEGLRSCKYGILIVSKNFLSNEKWAKWEFQSLEFKQITSGKKTILPIWLDVSSEEVSKYSLWLANNAAGDLSDGIDKLADKLVRVIKHGH